MRRVLFILLAACGGTINAKPDAGPDVIVVPEAGPPDARPDADTGVPLVCASGFGDCDADPRNGCEAALVDLYEDKDWDGFGVKKASTCPKTPGYAPMGDDCDDTNADVHPGQTAYFTIPRGDGTFDYDCDAKEARHWPDLNAGFCFCSNGCSASPDGWDWDGMVPVCGAKGSWFASDLNDCSLITTPRTQACR